ncbi:MAG: type II secretion system major pseudopilin GspG [Alphaproteobacteria bacterium]|nr:type II secretion system major pseudopilin GspG [Alphaproteobacteria bacterium]
MALHGSNGRRRRRQRGFTLIELLVVLTILALIGGVVGTQVLRYVGTAKSETARLQMNQISSALDLFRLDVGRYPSQAEGLRALVERPAGLARWNGPYLKGGQLPADPWERAYVYRMPGSQGRDFDLISLGADGQVGGSGEAADIVLN